MKERNHLGSFRVDARNICPFASIAPKATETKIIGDSRTTMLPGDNVINMKRVEGKGLSLARLVTDLILLGLLRSN